MRKTKNIAADAQSLANTISRIEADLRSLKVQCEMMDKELAAAKLASSEAAEAQRAAEVERDAASERRVEVEQELETERTIRALAAAKLRETCELLDANNGRADAPQCHDDDVAATIRSHAKMTIPRAAIAPGRLPRPIAAACIDHIARGTATDIESALLYLAELGRQTLVHPHSEAPCAHAHPEPSLSPFP